MSTAVVAGALALLLNVQPSLTPAQAKAALQVTSSRLPGAGLIEAGAGEVNVVAALALVSGNARMGAVLSVIASEQVSSSGISYGVAPLGSTEADILVWGNALTPVPAQVTADILVWGNILVWG